MFSQQLLLIFSPNKVWDHALEMFDVVDNLLGFGVGNFCEYWCYPIIKSASDGLGFRCEFVGVRSQNCQKCCWAGGSFAGKVGIPHKSRPKFYAGC